MRWFWIDRFTEFHSGTRAVAIKNVSLAEEHLHDHFPGVPVMPASLVIEGLAQTGGLLVGEHSGFREKVVLAKVPKVVFHGEAVPGDTLEYTCTIEYIKKDGAMVQAESRCNGAPHAEAEIVFAHLNGAFEGKTLFEPWMFRRMMRMLGVYSVGKNADGTPMIEPPADEDEIAQAQQYAGIR